MNDASRRLFLSGSTILGADLLLGACKSSSAGAPRGGKPDDNEKGEEAEVTATEDLMREHGVLRRALVIFRESSVRLRADAGAVPAAALQKAAMLFRSFGEDYHERKLEEAYIFPAVKKAGGPAAPYADILLAQHNRGRELTDYLLAATQGPKIGANAPALAKVLEDFARMYESHTAIEDTVIFPAWKKTMSPKELDEMGDRFEDIERATFGKDGFDDAVDKIAAIEAALGLSDLAQFTAPAPPKT